MTQYIEHESTIERLNEDGSVSFIPKDESNADYQRYLNPETTPTIEVTND